MRNALIGIMSLVMLGGSAMAQSVDDFVFDNANELVTLCGAKPGSPNHTAAMSFCYGYGHGAFQYYTVQSMAKGGSKFVCVPKNAPTRSEMWVDFIAWMKKNPQYGGAPAVDAIFRYLGTKYPC